LRDPKLSIRTVMALRAANKLRCSSSQLHPSAVALLPGVPAWHTPGSPSLDDDGRGAGTRPPSRRPLGFRGPWGGNFLFIVVIVVIGCNLLTLLSSAGLISGFSFP